MEMVCQLPCLSILQTPWGHDLDENSVQASSILKPPCPRTQLACLQFCLSSSSHPMNLVACEGA